MHKNNITLLYVEDNKDIMDTTIDIINEFVPEVNNIIPACDGEIGLDKFKQNQNSIDLIIIDIKIPKIDGITLAKQIKQINPQISILVLSAYETTQCFLESIKIGVDGYFIKPINLKQFIQTLEKIVYKIQLAKEAKINLHFLKEYEDIINKSMIVSKTDLDGKITYVNNNFCDISGYSKDELIGKSHNIIRDTDISKELFEDIWNTIKSEKQIWKGVIKNRAKNGKSYYVDATIKPILDDNNNTIEYISLMHDITSIMNHKKLLNDTIKTSKDPCIIFIKLEDFKVLEELYADYIIEKIEEKVYLFLKKWLFDKFNIEKLFQLNNGEYATVIENHICLMHKKEFINSLKTFQEEIKYKAIKIDDIDYYISVIISLVYKGEERLKSAKLGIIKLLEKGKEFVISNNYAKIEQTKTIKNIKTISIIKKAINNNKIISYFQPIVNNKTQKIEKYESLARLIDENGKVLTPFFFLDIAKKGNYYSKITSIVLDNSFGVLKDIDSEVSINISILDIELKSTRNKIFSLLEHYKQFSSRIVIELLEDENIKNFKIIDTFINKVKSYGVKIAIDDFGSGYSNFERLLSYQPDILKIDGSLIKNILTNQYSASIVKTIVNFAKEQNIKTVAEFIENKNLFDEVKKLGIDYSQGYYFGKPKPIIEIL